jgi:hypothetical protein
MGGHIYENMSLFLAIAVIITFISKNSNELVGEFEITSNKQLMASSMITITVFVAALYKIIYIPYTEFIYFNF